MASEEGGWGKTERSGWIRFDSIRFRFDSTRLSFPRTRLPTEGGGATGCRWGLAVPGGEALWVGPFGFFGWR